MTKEEIDTMWQQAMQESIKDGEMFTRYHFAEMVTEAERERIKQANAPEIEKINAHIQKAMTALEEVLAEHAMREVQRLGQEIEQEPVELPCCGYTDASAVKWNPFNGVVQCHNCGQCYTHPPQRTEQEPVAWICEGSSSDEKHAIDYWPKDLDAIPIGTMLYTHPPQRKPLTNNEIGAIGSKIFPATWNTRHVEFARAIEAAHDIKENT